MTLTAVGGFKYATESAYLVRFFPPLQPHVLNKVSVVSIQTFASSEPNVLGQRRPTDGFHHLLYAGVERIWVFVVTNFYLLMFSI